MSPRPCSGTYVVMDNYNGQMVSGFEHSLTVQASVISTQSGKVIVDVGSKSITDSANVAIVGHDHKSFRPAPAARRRLRRPDPRLLPLHRQLLRRLPRNPRRHRHRHPSHNHPRPRPPRPPAVMVAVRSASLMHSACLACSVQHSGHAGGIHGVVLIGTPRVQVM
jgi:hypothetical protein